MRNLHLNLITQIIFVIAFALPGVCSGQSKMLYDQQYDGEVYYRIKTTHISSVSHLPVKIQINITGYLKQALGCMYDSISFSHGQIVNLKKNFKHDTAVYRQEWIAPKYDLSFLLHDKSIGIKNYYIKIQMDEFGQIIFSNWPRRWFSDRQKLSQLDEIEKIALKIADQKKYEIQGYTVELEYDSKSDRLFWCFCFPRELKGTYNSYNVVLIDWNNHTVIDDSNIREIGVSY